MHNDFNYTLKLKTGLARLLGVEISGLDFLAKGYRNSCYLVRLASGQELKGEQQLVLIVYKKESTILQKIKRAGKLGKALRIGGLPARTPVSDIIKLDHTPTYACLYNFLPGQTLPWEAFSKNHIKAIGQTMAKLHLAGRDVKLDHSAVTDFEQSIETSLRYLDRVEVKSALQQKLGLTMHTTALKTALPKLISILTSLPQINLHMDLVRSNLLFSPDKQISGILDFEKCGQGPAVLDITRSLSFLLVDVEAKTPEKIVKYFIRSGYLKAAPTGSNMINLKLVNLLVNCFLVYDFYKFLKHNPYESLHDNRHFLRTRSYLISSKLCANI